MVERGIAGRLGIPAKGRTRFAVVGGTIEFSVGVALLEVEGRRFRVPVILGDRNLIGRTTLETLGFAVDPVENRLVPKPGILYAAVPNAGCGGGLEFRPASPEVPSTLRGIDGPTSLK